MICAEKDRLRGEYSTAVVKLREALHGLEGKTGKDLTKALAATASARARCATTRRALADHKARHGC